MDQFFPSGFLANERVVFHAQDREEGIAHGDDTEADPQRYAEATAKQTAIFLFIWLLRHVMAADLIGRDAATTHTLPCHFFYINRLVE